eukprot:m.309291 g.309291  ORF g.309291 m.309291 type:complete len:361 (+) comp45998_c0_seq1:430-1512(+)
MEWMFVCVSVTVFLSVSSEIPPTNHGNGSSVVSLGKLVQPSINATRKDYDVFGKRVGEKVVFLCKTAGKPRPWAYWFRHSGSGNWTLVPPSRTKRKSQSEVSLFIAEAKVTDSGLYKCKASSAIGKTSRLLRLEIGAPEAPDAELECGLMMFRVICKLSWKRPLYTGYGNPQDVLYAVEDRVNNGEWDVVTTRKKYHLFVLPITTEVFEVFLWTVTAAGTSTYAGHATHRFDHYKNLNAGTELAGLRDWEKPATLPDTDYFGRKNETEVSAEPEEKTIVTSVIVICVFVCVLPILVTGGCLLSSSVKRAIRECKSRSCAQETASSSRSGRRLNSKLLDLLYTRRSTGHTVQPVQGSGDFI